MQLSLSYILIHTHIYHDDVIKWKHFPRYWPFVRGIHRCPVNFQHKGQWRGALMFSLRPSLCEFYMSTMPWWRHQVETFFALLAICAGNSPVPGEFPTQRPVTRGFDVYFDLRLNKQLSKHLWGWWFETLSRPLWHHHNANMLGYLHRKALQILQFWGSIPQVKFHKGTNGFSGTWGLKFKVPESPDGFMISSL